MRPEPRVGVGVFVQLLTEAIDEVVHDPRDLEAVRRRYGIRAMVETAPAVALGLGISPSRTLALARRALNRVAFAGRRAKPAPRCAALTSYLDRAFRSPEGIDPARLAEFIRAELGYLSPSEAITLLAGLSGAYPHESAAVRRQLGAALDAKSTRGHRQG